MSLDWRKLMLKSKRNAVIFHVGINAGMYSELYGMLQVILFCHQHGIDFILYADDANWANGKGWELYFKPFGVMNHDRLNHYANVKDLANPFHHPFKFFSQVVIAEHLRRKYGVKYLTQDIFKQVIDRKVSQKEVIIWPEYNINGPTFYESAKISKWACCYNELTMEKIRKKIQRVNLKENYCSVQMRGGDKTIEYKNLNKTDVVVERIEASRQQIRCLFVFTDDYRYVKEFKELRPEWEIITLTKETECGYSNSTFQRKKEAKEEELIKLFAMVQICIDSSVHFGNEQTCVNLFIRSAREGKGYIPIWFEDD